MLRDELEDIPVFDDFAVVIEPKNINACPIGVPWPLLITMQDHVVAFGNHPLEVDTLAWIVLCHLREGGAFVAQGTPPPSLPSRRRPAAHPSDRSPAHSSGAGAATQSSSVDPLDAWLKASDGLAHRAAVPVRDNPGFSRRACPPARAGQARHCRRRGVCPYPIDLTDADFYPKGALQFSLDTTGSYLRVVGTKLDHPQAY